MKTSTYYVNADALSFYLISWLLKIDCKYRKLMILCNPSQVTFSHLHIYNSAWSAYYVFHLWKSMCSRRAQNKLNGFIQVYMLYSLKVYVISVKWINILKGNYIGFTQKRKERSCTCSGTYTECTLNTFNVMMTCRQQPHSIHTWMKRRQ